MAMASKTASRSLHAITRRTRPSCQCAPSTSSQQSSIRQISVSSRAEDAQSESSQDGRPPRWSYTPKAMIAPFQTSIKNSNKAWVCNTDPERLDAFYIKFLGRGGDKVLTEEIKWLAVTHKSFDQGRRGFNDRLAFFGTLRNRSTAKCPLTDTQGDESSIFRPTSLF
jgi:large subunit ribosomal protein L15